MPTRPKTNRHKSPIQPEHGILTAKELALLIGVSERKASSMIGNEIQGQTINSRKLTTVNAVLRWIEG